MSVKQPQYKVCVNTAGECIESCHPKSTNIEPDSTELHVVQSGSKSSIKVFTDLSDSHNIFFCPKTGLRFELPKEVNTWGKIESYFEDENFDEDEEEFCMTEDELDNVEEAVARDNAKEERKEVYSDAVKVDADSIQEGSDLVEEEGDWDRDEDDQRKNM